MSGAGGDRPARTGETAPGSTGPRNSVADVARGRFPLPRPFTRFLGFSCLVCWFVAILAGPFARGGVVMSGLAALVPVCLGASLAAFAVLLVTLRIVPLSRRWGANLALGVLASAGSCGLMLSVGVIDPWVIWAGELLAGAGVMWLALAWQEFFAAQGVREALLGMAVLCALGVALFGVLCLLPEGIAAPIALLMPAVGALTLRPPRGTRFYVSYAGDISTPQLLANILNDYSPRMFVLCALVTMAAVCGCAPLLPEVLWGGTGPLTEWGAVGLPGAAMALGCAFVAFERPRRIMRLFYATLPLVALGVVLAFCAVGVASRIVEGPLVWAAVAGSSGSMGLASLALAVAALGLSGVFCLVWVLMVDCSHRKRLPALGLVASLSAACFAGVVLGLVVSAGIGYDPALGAVVALAALVVACLLFASFNGRVAISEESFAAPQRTSQEQAVLALAERCRLTPRETEILQVWLAGHNAAYIEGALHISRNTVKTHLNHIYQKTGTSGREDLLAALDEAAGR